MTRSALRLVAGGRFALAIGVARVNQGLPLEQVQKVHPQDKAAYVCGNDAYPVNADRTQELM